MRSASSMIEVLALLAVLVAVSAALGAQPAAAQPRNPATLAPDTRTGGDLVVPSVPPANVRPVRGARLRMHIQGSLSRGSRRTWIGPPVPAHIALTEGTLELFLLDAVAQGGHLAFYRDPYGASSCTLGGPANCAFAAAWYDASGARRWLHRLDALFSRRDHLEIQDIRLAEDGTLYFNEACATYAREAQNRCSALVAYDPVAGRVLWRTRHLISNGQLEVTPLYLVVGYGFTAEKDYVSLVRRSDGRVLVRQRVQEAPSGLRLEASGPGGPREEIVYDTSYGTVRMRIVGASGAPRLVTVTLPPPPPASRAVRITPG